MEEKGEDEEQELAELLKLRNSSDNDDFDDIDSDVDELCDALELSFISERRQLNDIEETKQRVQFLIHQGDEESLNDAADEAQGLAERIQIL